MRKFLVVLDDSRECLNAIRFAALRAAHTGGGVTILSIIPPEEFQHWIGVADLMREEARERIEAHFEVFAKWMRDKHGIQPELVIREGKPVDEILGLIEEDPEIGILVLGAGSDRAGPSSRHPTMRTRDARATARRGTIGRVGERMESSLSRFGDGGARSRDTRCCRGRPDPCPPPFRKSRQGGSRPGQGRTRGAARQAAGRELG